MPDLSRVLFVLYMIALVAAVCPPAAQAAAQLPPEILIDSRLLQVEQAVRDSNYARARDLLRAVLALQAEHQVELPTSYHFWSAKAAESLSEVIESAMKYLTEAGREGAYYGEALEMMNNAANALCKGWNTDEYFRSATPEEVAACLNIGKSAVACGDDNETPMHNAAAFSPHAGVARALIEAGGDPRARDDSDETPLHRAAGRNANVDMARILIEAGADPRARDVDNETPLYEALQSNANDEVVRFLIDAGGYSDLSVGCKAWNTDEYFKTATLEGVSVCLEIGANPREVDDEKVSRLHAAARANGYPAVIKALIDAGADPDARDMGKRTPLHYAAENGDPAILGVLLKAGADLEATDWENYAPLHHAAVFNENADVIDFMVKAGADVEATTETKFTPLHLAASANGNPLVIGALIKAGAKTNAKDNLGQTPLHKAAGSNVNPDAIKALLNAGANVNAMDDVDRTPLHKAAGSNVNPDVIKALLNAGANVMAKCRYGETPLHLAAGSNGNPDVIRELLNAGADVKAKSIELETPLHLAARSNGNPDMSRLLLNAGARVKSKDKFGETPLHDASRENKNPDVISVLLIAGAKLEASDRYGRTPLHHAARVNKNPNVIRVLLNSGAKVTAKDKFGESPLDLAEESNKHPDVIRELLNAGDEPGSQSLPNQERRRAEWGTDAQEETTNAWVPRQTRGNLKHKCEIPGYYEGNFGDTMRLGLSWCPNTVDFQTRAFALQIAGMWCTIYSGEFSATQVETRKAQIRQVCEQLDALARHNGVQDICGCDVSPGIRP